MGLIFSGEVSDFVLYWLLELSFLLVPSVQAKFRISGVFRFKDDLMLFVDGPRWSIDALIRVMQVKSKFFKLKLESCCMNSARFLDLEISNGPRWRTTGCLDYQVVVKQSHLGIVLDDSSSHPNSVHSTWPISIFTRIACRSSSLAVCKVSQDSFVAKFDRDCPDHVVRPALKSLQLFRRPLVSIAAVKRPKCSSWIVIPFHQAWHKAKLGSKLCRIHDDAPSVISSFIEDFRAGISWSLGGQHLYKVLKGLRQNSIHPSGR